MDWNLISQISTTIGALGTASSVFAGYRMYIKSQKDEYLKNVRMLLSTIESNCRRLNYLATYELLHDLSYGIVYSDDVKSMLMFLIKKFEKYFLKAIDDYAINDIMAVNFAKLKEEYAPYFQGRENYRTTSA